LGDSSLCRFNGEIDIIKNVRGEVRFLVESGQLCRPIISKQTKNKVENSRVEIEKTDRKKEMLHL